MSALIDSGGSGQEMPAAYGARTAIALQVVFLLGRGDLGRLLRIEAHRDDIEFVADIKLHHPHRAGEPGESFAAEHGAVVVDEVQDQRLFAEVFAQFDAAPGLVDEREIGRHLPVKMLLDADVLQIRRSDVRRRRHDAFCHCLSPGRWPRAE